jgi:hypothetical protein
MKERTKVTAKVVMFKVAVIRMKDEIEYLIIGYLLFIIIGKI